jgi:hypothetical protein
LLLPLQLLLLPLLQLQLQLVKRGRHVDRGAEDDANSSTCTGHCAAAACFFARGCR